MHTIEKFSSFAKDRLVPIHYDSDDSSINAYPRSITCSNSMPSTTNSKALVLPNFPQPKHLLPFNSFDSKDIHIKIWQLDSASCYSDPEVMFKTESIVGSKQAIKQSNDGIIIITSQNTAGIKAISELIDLVTALIRVWYPDLQRHKHGLSGLKQRVPCFECIKLDPSFEFDIEQCLQVIVENKTVVECDYFQGDLKKDHCVFIKDITPDLLLLNVNPASSSRCKISRR